MPNIEIHGVLEKRDALRLEKDIFKVFSQKTYVDEMVVTRFTTVATDKKGVCQPFLRLVNSCQEHTEEIIEKLRVFGMDIEYLQLKAFHPKQPCGCEGSCPVCRTGEVDNHKCGSCGVEFCPNCHGISNSVESENVLICSCKSN